MPLVVGPLKITKRVFQSGGVAEVTFRVRPPDRAWRRAFFEAMEKTGRQRERALEKLSEPERIVRFFDGWEEDPLDADGNPVAFTPETFVEICRGNEWFHEAAAAAVVEAITFGVQGNSGASPAGSTTGEAAGRARPAAA